MIVPEHDYLILNIAG